MSKHEKTKIKLAVLRTLGVRLTQAEFAMKFKQFEPHLIGDLNPEVIKYAQANKLRYKDIPLENAYYLDPVKLILGRTTHQSWTGPDQRILEGYLQNIDIYEVYEPYFFYSCYVAQIAKKYNKPLVTEIWTSFPKHPARFVWPYSKNVKTTIGQTDLFIARSHRALNYLKPYKIPEHKVEVIYHGVNLSRFYPDVHQGTKRVNILFVGTLSQHKGLADILDIWPSLQKMHPEISLTVCGSGVLLARVKQMAQDYNINYLGQVAHDSIPEIYQDAQIFCGPSKDYYFFGIKRWEEFVGYVFMEAMACGLPIVTTDSGGIREIVGKDNYIIKQGDQKALERALSSLIIDAKERAQIGRNNRARAQRLFDLDKQVAKTEKLLLKTFFS